MQNNENPIDLNPEIALETINGWVDGATAIAPALVAAILFFIFGYIVTSIVRALVSGRLKKSGRRDLGLMIGGLIKGAGVIGFGLIALSIVVPTIRPGDLVAGLGIGSVAIGFAFKDILQNWLAGFLILLRQPFLVGDVVEIGDHTGIVEHIETRSTRLKTFNGHRAIIPNSEVFTNAVLVKTAFDQRRSEYDIGIGYGDDLDGAIDAIIRAVESVEGVETDPGVQALTWDLAASWVTIRARWWTNNETANIGRHALISKEHLQTVGTSVRLSISSLMPPPDFSRSRLQGSKNLIVSENEAYSLSFGILVSCGLFTASNTLKSIPSTSQEIYWSDGDSGRIDGMKFRLANVDAPETGGVGARGGAKCESERKLGYDAKAFVVEFTRNAELVITSNSGPDRYEREVITLLANGRDVGQAGIEAGHLGCLASQRAQSAG